MSTFTGRQGQIELTGSKAGITVLLDWVETYNTVTNTSTVTITKMQGKSARWYGISYFLRGSIAINGVDVITFGENHYLYWGALNTFTNLRVRRGAKLPPWGTDDINHNGDGTKTVDITFSFTGITDSGTAESGWVVDEVVSIALTDIPVPEPEPDPDIPEPEPEPMDPTMIFAYDGRLVLSPRYEGKLVSFAIIPHTTDGDESTAVLGTGKLGHMILGSE